MKKSNVTKKLPAPIGWLIYRPDTEEFFLKHIEQPGLFANVFTKEPAFAYLYHSERLAFICTGFIDEITEVLPLFDYGYRLAVGFPCDTEA